MKVLRPYQVEAVNRLRELLLTLRRPRRAILQAETGAGKTIMSLEPMRLCYERGNRALFIARGRELVLQCADDLEEWGIPHALLMSGHGYYRAPVTVASKDTLVSWVKGGKVELPPADLVVIDECHESLARWWRWLIEQYAEAVVVGLTATPARGDGRGLAPFYGGMAQAIPPSRLIAEGYLVPTRVFAPYRPDLSGVEIDRRTKDYKERPLARAMDTPQLVGDVVGHWKELGEGRQTIVYAVDVQHSLDLRDAFVNAGVACEHVDGTTETGLRDATLRRLADGTTTVVCNVGVLVQGVDVPAVSCGVLARPTRSFTKFRQMCGRLKRPHPGKTHALLLDHAGCVYLHGLPDDDVEWTLESTRPAHLGRPGQPPGGPTPVTCPKCHAAFRGPACPSCGHRLRRRQAQTDRVQPEAGKLVEVATGEAGGTSAEATREAKVRYWHRCLGVCANTGRRPGAAAQMYRQKFGQWPDPAELPNVPPFHQHGYTVADLYPQYVRAKAEAGGTT